MTSREARKERREQGRKAAKLADKAAKATGELIGFVSQKRDQHVAADHQPASSTEEFLVNEMAQSYWLQQRAIRLQNDCFTENGVDEKRLALFLRYGATHNGTFYKALTTLTRLQKERRKLRNGFVSQNYVTAANHAGFVSQNERSADPQIGFVSQTDLITQFPKEQATPKQLNPPATSSAFPGASPKYPLQGSRANPKCTRAKWCGRKYEE